VSASPPVVYDVTYVAARLGAVTPTGIERVDAAFARHFAIGRAGVPDRQATALHYGLLRPHGISASSARKLLAEADRAWTAEEALSDDQAFQAVSAWLAEQRPRTQVLRVAGRPLTRARRTAQLMARTPWRLHNDGAVVPPGALYLTVAQYALEYPWFLRWLDRRRDVKPVFFIHDLLPLDCPEFFREGYWALFERRVATMARFAQGAIVSSGAVAERVGGEMRRRGRRDFPIHAAALPPPTRGGTVGAWSTAAQGRAAPYFVAVGTIEPRKNHLLLLNVWRDLAVRGGAVPRLVLVGPRGWDNEQVLDLLDRSRMLAPHVAELSGLSTPGLRRLIAGARALLAPSFAEGYGLPLAEALAEGTPVLAADIPVFREVSQGRALLLDPLDGPGWRDAVRQLTPQDSSFRAELAAQAARYVAPDWPAYLGGVEEFLTRV
jgi:hypothetical protein